MKTKKKAYSDARDTKDSIKQPMWQADQALEKYLEKKNYKYYKKFCLKVIKLYFRMRTQIPNLTNKKQITKNLDGIKTKIANRFNGNNFKTKNFQQWMTYYEALQDAVADIGITEITKTEKEYENGAELAKDKLG